MRVQLIRMGVFGLLAAAGLAAAAAPARAAIVSVAPFVGSASETWESFPNYFADPDFFLDDPTAIFGGAAMISNPVMVVYEPGVADFGLGGSGLAQVADGVKGMGLNDFASTATIVFTDPVTAFGGYWGAATLGGPTTVFVEFFDADGVSLGSDSFTYDREAEFDGLLEWHGWASTMGGIKSMTYTGDFVVNDALQIDGGAAAIPEPASLVLLGSAAVAAGARRLRRRPA
jgi:hypothetical protein